MNVIPKYETDSIDQKNNYMTGEFGPAKEIRLEQVGDLDLQFSGWNVSKCGDYKVVEDVDKASVQVRLFYTSRGSYVAEITRNFPDFRHPGKRLTKSKAAAFTDVREMLQWLKEDGKGWLGTNSKIAWEELCSRLPWLRQEATVRV